MFFLEKIFIGNAKKSLNLIKSDILYYERICSIVQRPFLNSAALRNSRLACMRACVQGNSGEFGAKRKSIKFQR